MSPSLPCLKIIINLCLIFCSFSFIPPQTLRHSLHQKLCQTYRGLIDCLTNEAITKQDKVPHGLIHVSRLAFLCSYHSGAPDCSRNFLSIKMSIQNYMGCREHRFSWCNLFPLMRSVTSTNSLNWDERVEWSSDFALYYLYIFVDTL